jgi:hypothetical protein
MNCKTFLPSRASFAHRDSVAGLLDPTQNSIPKFEIHFTQLGPACSPDRKTSSVESHRFEFFIQDLAPYGNQGVFQA